MDEHEIQRVAAGVNGFRPDWAATSIASLIRGSRLKSMPRRDAMVAFAWVAADTNTKTPGRVLESGPWWQAVGGFTAEREASPRHPKPHEACADCGRHHDRCLCTDDHGKPTGPTRHLRPGVPPDPGLRANMRASTAAARAAARTHPEPRDLRGSVVSEEEA